jgi:hypothetical protein
VFEKFPKFCGACGYLGHTHLECGTGEHDENLLKWGDWLKAEWSTWHGQSPPGIHGGGHDGHGREPFLDGRGKRPVGRGDGAPQSWRHNALSYKADGTLEDEELKDTGTSPMKNPGTEVENSDNSSELGEKRRLALPIENTESCNDNIQGVLDSPEAMVTDETALLLANYG